MLKWAAENFTATTKGAVWIGLVDYFQASVLMTLVTDGVRAKDRPDGKWGGGGQTLAESLKPEPARTQNFGWKSRACNGCWRTSEEEKKEPEHWKAICRPSLPSWADPVGPPVSGGQSELLISQLAMDRSRVCGGGGGGHGSIMTMASLPSITVPSMCKTLSIYLVQTLRCL